MNRTNQRRAAPTEQTDPAGQQCGIWRRLTRETADLNPEAGNGARAERSRSDGEVGAYLEAGGQLGLVERALLLHHRELARHAVVGIHRGERRTSSPV